MKLIEEIVNSFQPLLFFGKSAILNVWLDNVWAPAHVDRKTIGERINDLTAINLELKKDMSLNLSPEILIKNDLESL